MAPSFFRLSVPAKRTNGEGFLTFVLVVRSRTVSKFNPSPNTFYASAPRFRLLKDFLEK